MQTVKARSLSSSSSRFLAGEQHQVPHKPPYRAEARTDVGNRAILLYEYVDGGGWRWVVAMKTTQAPLPCSCFHEAGKGARIGPYHPDREGRKSLCRGFK